MDALKRFAFTGLGCISPIGFAVLFFLGAFPFVATLLRDHDFFGFDGIELFASAHRESLWFSGMTACWSLLLWAWPAWLLAQRTGWMARLVVLGILISIAFPSLSHGAWILDIADQMGLDTRGVLRLPLAALSMSCAVAPFMFLPIFCYTQLNYKRNDQQGRALGMSTGQAWHKIHLPQAKGVLAASLMLVMFEAWSHLEIPEYYNIQTVSVAVMRRATIYRQPQMALLWSMLALLPTLVIVFCSLGVVLKKNRSLAHMDAGDVCLKLSLLEGLFLCPCLILSFMGPLLSYGYGTLMTLAVVNLRELWDSILHSLQLSILSALCSALFALFFLVTYWSGKGGAKLKGMLVFSILPLACSSLMVGLLMMELPLWNGGGGDWLSESSWPMVWANFIRCMGVAALMTLLILRSVPQRYGYHLESLGYARTSQIWTVLLSWRAQALLSIFCLTFMLGMRDVPIALLLQPFDHSMLSAKMHQYFSEGEWQKASPQVMVVMMLSFPPLLWLSQSLIPKRTTC